MLLSKDTARWALSALLAAPLISAMPPAQSQSIITQPQGLLTNPANTLISDPPAPDTWLRRNVRSGGAVGIDGSYPRAGAASMFLEIDTPNAGAAGKADAEYFPLATFGRLADLQTIAYEWYRDSVSASDAWLHPVLRLVVDADGNPLTTNDQGYLIFERCYNVPGCAAAPTDTWVAETITGSTILWWFQFGVGAENVFTRSLSTYQAGSYTPTPGFAQLGPNSLVLGVSLGVGSGWVGGPPAFRGAVDLVRIESSTPGAASIFHNFESTADMAAGSLSGLPPIIGPGQTVISIFGICQNVDATGSAADADCTITSTLGTINNLSCAPQPPVAALPAGGSIVCVFDLADGNTPGGGTNAQSAGVVTVTASASNDTNPDNNVLSQTIVVLDAVNDAAAFLAGSSQTFNLASNDTLPSGFSYTYTLLSASCPAAAVSPAGVASFTVPGSGSCTIDYRVCADPPNQTACDTATLTVTAEAPPAQPAPPVQPIPTLDRLGLIALCLLLGLIAVRRLH